MKKITEYTVIDQVGSFDERRDVGAVYKNFFKLAYNDETKPSKVYTMKQLCKVCWNGKESDFEKKLDGMKWAMRNQKTPKKVYIICEGENADIDKHALDEVQKVAKKWADRGIDTEVYIFSQKYHWQVKLPLMAFGDIPWKRRCALIWAEALGWSFSAPIWRFGEQQNNLDLYMHRQDREEMQSNAATASHITKTFGRESYLKHFRAICPDEEIDRFYQFWLEVINFGCLKDVLDPDWVLYKGMPARKNFEGKVRSEYYTFEDENFDENIVTRYYDDSYNNDEE